MPSFANNPTQISYLTGSNAITMLDELSRVSYCTHLFLSRYAINDVVHAFKLDLSIYIISLQQHEKGVCKSMF